MARRMIIAGNWKMNKTPSEAVELINMFKETLNASELDVVCCVPAIDLIPAKNAAEGSDIKVGAQNIYFEDKGAYTGEISAPMLVDAGIKYTVIGHSERREYFGETDVTVNKKIHKAFEYGITPIMCCGETLEEREQGITMDLVRQQVKVGFLGLTAEQAKEVVIAYEPIWAIGTGKTATSDQAEEVCKTARDTIRELYGDEVADAIRVIYGGSVKGSNAADLFSKEDIDGGLVGGASLNEEFIKIVNFK